jgi:hypothetical protein
MNLFKFSLKARPQDLRGYLNQILPQKWIGRTGQENYALIRWPPRSPDLTPCYFFFWGFVKDTVFVPPLPANLRDLCNRITAAVALVNRNLLTRVWDEMSAISAKVDTLSICELCKKKKTW